MAPKLSADVSGDYTIQGAEITGLTGTIHGQLRNSPGKEHRVDSVMPVGVLVVMVHGLWEIAAWAPFCPREPDWVTWWVPFIKKESEQP